MRELDELRRADAWARRLTREIRAVNDKQAVERQMDPQ